MTDVAYKKHEIEKEIRALLMSSPVALTIEELRRDFNIYMERPIPYRELGYSMLEDMLRDMRDVLHITYKRGMMVLEVIADDTTRHIAKLVSKQKIPNKQKYAATRKGPPHRAAQRRQVSSSVPHYIQKNISELFRCYSNGLPLTHLETAYSKRFGSMFSFKRLGFVSLMELLYSLPDIIVLKEYQGGEWRVLPAGVKKEQEKLINNENRAPNDMRSQESINVMPYRVVAQQKPGRGRGMKRSASGGDQTSVGRESLSSSDSHEPEVEDKLQNELREMLAGKPEGIISSQLPFIYKATYNKALNFQELGYMSVIELCNSFPDIRIERPTPKGDWVLFDARIPRKSPEKAEQEEKKERHESANQELKEKIRQVVMCKKDGIPLGEFLAFYEKLTGECLPVEELGFRSVDRFLLSLTDTLLQFKYKGDGIIMVLPLDPTAPQKTDRLKYIPEPEEEVKSTIPDDGILPGACYRHIDLPVLGEYFEVFVSNIESPGVFWFQIRSKQSTVALEKLMNQIEHCYKSAEGNQYRIPDELIVVGLVVAAVFPEDGNWHRCVITKLETGHLIEVYFVDYGNTCSVHRNTIRLLRSKFLKLPMQAIRGRLANIQPQGSQKWSLNARNKLLSMCINTPLVALATAEKDRVMSLVLIDTSHEDDICYNDVLVHEGYAVFKPDDHTTNLTGLTDATEIRDYSLEYGVTGTGSQSTCPDTASLTALSSHDTDLSEIKQRFVKETQLTSKYKIHVINIDGIARVLSEEISAFLFDTDVLTGMLQQKRKNFSRIEISVEEQPQVFMELQEYGAIPATRKCLSLYELHSIPMILEVFNYTSEDLVNSIKDLMKKFDPEEAYWKCEEEGDAGSEDSLAVGMDREKIELTIETLQYKRKRILHSLMDVTVSQSEEVVNELNHIEQQITQLKEAFEKAPKAKPDEDKGKFEDAETGSQNTKPGSKSELFSKPLAPASVSPVKMTNVVTPMRNTAPPSLTKLTNQTNPSAVTPMLNLTPQQILFQQMLMTQMNQQVIMNPLYSHLMLGQIGNFNTTPGQGLEGQATNMTPTLPMGNVPSMGNFMPPLGLPNMPMGMLNLAAPGRDLGGQGDGPELQLLPGLLPLLQNLSLGRGSGNRSNNSGSK